MSIWDISNINNPELTDRVLAYSWMIGTSKMVKYGRRTRHNEKQRPGVTMPYRLYAKSSKSSRGKK